MTGLAGGFIGLVVGANYGGNQATDFVFAGQRGYEATGMLGALVGCTTGVIGAVIVASWRQGD